MLTALPSPCTAAAVSPPSNPPSLLESLLSSSSFDLGRKILIFGRSADSAEAEPLLCGVKDESMSLTRAELECRNKFLADEDDTEVVEVTADLLAAGLYLRLPAPELDEIWEESANSGSVLELSDLLAASTTSSSPGKRASPSSPVGISVVSPPWRLLVVSVVL